MRCIISNFNFFCFYKILIFINFNINFKIWFICYTVNKICLSFFPKLHKIYNLKLENSVVEYI